MTVPSPPRAAAGATMRTALVHDWLNQDGGAEVVLSVLHDMFPEAPIFTTIADGRSVPASREWDVRASWMDRLPAVHGRHQPYLPLYPLAWQRTHLEGYDLVLSNKSGFCHGVDKGQAAHVCYCLTPTRYVWEPEPYIRHETVPPGTRAMLRLLVPWLRRWELAAAAKVDRFVAISTEVQRRIERFYDRDSVIVYPPVNLDDLSISTVTDDTYVVLARLVPYKRIDIAVQAFNQLQRKLVVIGDGRDRPRLESMAGATIEFRGRLPREEVANAISRCRALIWPGVEDFGLAPVEAMAAGRPVVARRAGGVLDTIVEGKTGVFFDDASSDQLAAAVALVDAIDWQPEAIRAHASRFGRDVFEQQLRSVIGETMAHAQDRSGQGGEDGRV